MILEWIGLPHPVPLHLASSGQEYKEKTSEKIVSCFCWWWCDGKRERGAKIYTPWGGKVCVLLRGTRPTLSTFNEALVLMQVALEGTSGRGLRWLGSSG